MSGLTFVRLTGADGLPVYVRPELVACISGWKTDTDRVKTRVTAAYGAHEWVRESPEHVVALLKGAEPQPEQGGLL